MVFSMMFGWSRVDIVKDIAILLDHPFLVLWPEGADFGGSFLSLCLLVHAPQRVLQQPAWDIERQKEDRGLILRRESPEFLSQFYPLHSTLQGLLIFVCCIMSKDFIIILSRRQSKK